MDLNATISMIGPARKAEFLKHNPLGPLKNKLKKDKELVQ